MAQNKSYKELMELAGAKTGTNAQKANAMLELIEGRKPFAYDPVMDPAAQAVRKETARNIDRTTRDTMGSYAAMTGGLPSSAAVAAAAQAGNYAGAQGVDRVAELEQLARANYQQETADMQNMWSLFQNQADAERNQELEMAKLAAAYGDYSGLKGLGIDTSKMGAVSGYRSSGEDAAPTGLSAAVVNDLLLQYGAMLPAAVYDQYAAQYGADALASAGFQRQQTQQTAQPNGKDYAPAKRGPKAGMDDLHTRD